MDRLVDEIKQIAQDEEYVIVLVVDEAILLMQRWVLDAARAHGATVVVSERRQ